VPVPAYGPGNARSQVVDLARNVWGLSALVADATGVGAGLASFLADWLSLRGLGLASCARSLACAELDHSSPRLATRGIPHTRSRTNDETPTAHPKRKETPTRKRIKAIDNALRDRALYGTFEHKYFGNEMIHGCGNLPMDVADHCGFGAVPRRSREPGHRVGPV
jgi:hypothetical protein